jgi:parallel beta-helix repeat protein
MKKLLCAALLLASGHAALAKVIAVPVADDMNEAMQGALLDAKPGDTVQLPEGKFALRTGLSLDVPNVTVKGAGPDKTVLSFKGQTGAGEGLLVTSNNVLLTGFAVEDTKGDGIKSKGVDRITYHNLRVEWTNGVSDKNGAYGVYPVSSTNVLIDGVTVRYCSDAGIYVGQSKNIVVRNSLVEKNVAGIEIENSMNADVHDNVARHNTAGVLVFDLPNLPQIGGHSVRVFNNRIVDNDTPNFAPRGTIAATAPMGAGVMVMANRNIHVFDNEIGGNATANVLVVSYRNPFTDARYNPLPRDVWIGANRFGKGGWAPDFAGGKELAAAVGGALPDIVWDGAASFAAKDQPVTKEEVRIGAVGGMALSFGLAAQGASLETARPQMVRLATTPPSQVAAVVLPADQPMLR